MAEVGEVGGAGGEGAGGEDGVDVGRVVQDYEGGAAEAF